MKKVLTIGFILCGITAVGQVKPAPKNDSVDIVVLRYTKEAYNKLLLKIDSLNVNHQQVKELMNAVGRYTIERVPAKKP